MKVEDMRSGLSGMTVKELRSIVKKYNADVMIKGYSTMKKSDLIEAMLKKEVMAKIKTAPEVKTAPAPKRAKPPAPEIEEDEPAKPAEGPRNLKKGFGIRRGVERGGERMLFEKWREMTKRSVDPLSSKADDIEEIMTKLFTSDNATPEQKKELDSYAQRTGIGKRFLQQTVGKLREYKKELERMPGESIEMLKKAQPFIKKLNSGKLEKGEKTKTQNQIKKIMKGYKGVPIYEIKNGKGTDKFLESIPGMGGRAFTTYDIPRIIKEWNEKNVR